MPEGLFKRNLEKLQVLRQGIDLFRNCWQPMAGYSLIVWLTGLALVTPLTGWILNRLAAGSGDFVVGNIELVGWLLTPTGLLYLILVASAALLGLIIQIVGLIWIADTGGERGFLNAREILRRVLFTIC